MASGEHSPGSSPTEKDVESEAYMGQNKESQWQPKLLDPDEKTDEGYIPRKDGKYELSEESAYDELGFNFTSLRKWTILTVIFAVQVSMV